MLRASTSLTTLLLLAGCGGGSEAEVTDIPSDTTGTSYTPLTASQQLVRVSMALRGKRPSVVELTTIEANPDALDDLVTEWLETDDFATTIRDLHAYDFLVRTDTDEQLPSRGPLSDSDTWTVHNSITDEPMRLVEHVVMNDLPYTEVLTSEVMLADDIVSHVYGLPYDTDGPQWQVTAWNDGRPKAGLLSSSELWRRHRSAGSNFHRGRADFVASTFLCEPFSERDIPVLAGVDLSDEFAVANAVTEMPSCVGCHQPMDPMGAFFWGFRHQLKSRAVRLAYEANCTWDPASPQPLGEGHVMEDNCYPLRFYIQDYEDNWQDWDLRPPGYYGVPGERLDDLGYLIADDPRFAECTARRFWSWFAQEPREDMDDLLAIELADSFVASDFDAKALVQEIVTHERFLSASVENGDATDAPVGLLQIRPEQLDSTVRDLTGFTWQVDPRESNCFPTCWDTVNLMRSDLYGFRVMSGGIDSLQVTVPAHSPMPTLPMVLERFSSEAAATVVAGDFATSGDARILFSADIALGASEAEVRAELVALHLRILGEAVATDSAAVDASWELFSGAVALTGDEARAWTLVVSALMQDPRMVFY